MSTYRVLVILLTYCMLESYGKEYYLITTPSALLKDATQQFNIYLTTNIALIFEIKHQSSEITNRSNTIILKKGQHSVPFVIPSTNSLLGSAVQLRFLADNCSSLEVCGAITNVNGSFINESREIELLKDTFIIFSETDKPIYKPGDLVKMRMMAIYPTNLQTAPPSADTSSDILFNDKESTKKLQLTTFNSITLETPDNVKMAQWLNISFQTAMRLSFRLSNDPVFGNWKITTVIGSLKETTSFTVKKYVLPRFVVELIPPSVILLSDKNIVVKVCASYSTGKNMQALIRGELCMTVVKNICRTFASSINGTSRCVDILIDGAPFGLGGDKRIYYSSMSKVRVTVTENGTTHEVSKVAEGSPIRYVPYEIKFASLDYYKPGLPYFGKLKLLRHDGSPQQRTNVTVNLNNNFEIKWGYKENFTSDDYGVINFVIPYITVKSGLSVNIYGEKGSNASVIEAPTLYRRIVQWESVDNEYLVIAPLDTEIKCPGTIKLKLLMNADISTVTVYAQIMSRGLISNTYQFPPVPVKCTSRNDYLGHYTCIDDNKLKCLNGWQGGNCREPVCTNGCVNGACKSPNNCVCKTGWTGSTCTTCVVAKYCINGYCKVGHDCVCLPGWKGHRCEVRGPKIHHYAEQVTPLPTTFIPQTEPEYQKETIFERYIDINIEKNMGPDVHINLYYINAAGEVVTDSIEIKHGLTNCSHVGGGTFQFTDTTSTPGDVIKLSLDPGTVNKSCALRISDVALAQFGQSSNVNLNYLITRLLNLNHKLTTRNADTFGRNQCFPKRAKRRSYIWPWMNQGYDSRISFTHSGMIPITNARIINAQCQPAYIMPEFSVQLASENRYMFMNAPGLGGVREEKKLIKEKEVVIKQIREFFPETWIFDYYNVTPSQINLTVPDSMTSWQADSFCMTENGVWIAPSRYLTVILPFFADIYTPYSIKMGEKLQLPVKLFNYVDDCYEIKTDVTVNPNEIKISGPTSFTVCVCANDVKTLYFTMTANIIGKLNITVSAKSQYSTFCSRDSKQTRKVKYSDAIRRQLLVEPPGIQSELTFSELICNNNETLGLKSTFHIPSTIVAGSLRTYLVYNGDAMGQTFDNLDQLVRMPYGCGEQNMVALVPSIYVLNYLSNLNIHDLMLSKKAKEYIVNGYQRQLTYKHTDGSYSAFGKSDQSGNTWLTAFVLKSFSDASKFVTIDKRVLNESAQYLAKMQLPDGCFDERGKLLSSTMAGGVKNKGQNDGALLTSYVLISLYNTIISTASFNISKAIECVKAGLTGKPTAYRLALSGYTLSMYDPYSAFTSSIMDQLRNTSTSSGRYRYWKSGLDTSETYGRINSADVETTGYALLALQTYQSLPESLRTVYWLSNQRNSLGGYYSTQDTIVALNAISVLAGRIGATKFKKINLDVLLDDSVQHNDTITDIDRLVTRKINMGSKNISYVSITTNGTGCVSIQLISLFNILKLFTAEEEFKIDVKATFADVKLCTVLDIKVCSSYLRKDRNSNMILITINFPSGWELSSAERNELIKQLITPLKRIDFLENKMHWYYDSFSYSGDNNNARCLTFRLTQKSKIDKLKPSFIRMVDYYKPEIYTDTSYSIPMKTCQLPKEPIPKPRKEVRCPKCVNDTDKSVYDFISQICPWSFTGVVRAANNDTPERLFYESKERVFYEWSVALQPANCTCIQSWNHSTQDFVIVSSDWLWLNENLTLTNSSVMYPVNVLYKAYTSDLNTSCPTANHLYSLMTRLLPNFTTETITQKICSSCILLSNLHYKFKNITNFLCSKTPRWSMNVSAVANSTISGTLSNKKNQTIFINATFPATYCVCYPQLVDKKQFDVYDIYFSITITNNTVEKPLKLVFDGAFMLVESAVYTQYKTTTRCII